MHFDQNIIFIIIAAIIGISRLISRITEQSKKQSQRGPQTPQPPQNRPEEMEPIQRARPKTDDERVREFLEALGQPAGTAPPPKIPPRTQIPPRPLAPVQPPASIRPFAKPKFRTWKEQVKEIIVLQQPAAPKPPEIKRTLVPPPVPVAANEPGAWIAQEQAQAGLATKTVAQEVMGQPPISASADAIWKKALRSPDALKTAIILREIFGPPRGLQLSGFAIDTR